MYDHQRYAVYHANNVFKMALPPVVVSAKSGRILGRRVINRREE